MVGAALFWRYKGIVQIGISMWLGYIDPGAGSIILQTLIAAALGVAIFFRDAVKRAFLFVFGRRYSSTSTEESEPDSEHESET